MLLNHAYAAVAQRPRYPIKRDLALQQTNRERVAQSVRMKIRNLAVTPEIAQRAPIVPGGGLRLALAGPKIEFATIPVA
jgi:hypothetical protein